MVKKYLQLQPKLTFDELMTILSAEFEQLPDHRVGNATKYVLADVLQSAFAMFSLKCPSRLDFKQQTVPEQSPSSAASIRWAARFPVITKCAGGLMRSTRSCVKPDSHACLFQQCAGRRARGQVKERRETAAKGVQYRYRWTTHLCLNEGATAVHVNFSGTKRRTSTGW